VLFQLLTGRHLLGAETRFEAELLGRQLRARGEDPLPRRMPGVEELSPRRTAAYLRRLINLSPRFIEKETRKLPEGLRPILRKALAPQPEDRMNSGEELARALREYLDRSGVHYGRRELAAEVEALREATRPSLEDSSFPLFQGLVARLWRRKQPGS
jgi:hypothetical protein